MAPLHSFVAEELGVYSVLEQRDGHFHLPEQLEERDRLGDQEHVGASHWDELAAELDFLGELELPIEMLVCLHTSAELWSLPS